MARSDSDSHATSKTNSTRIPEFRLTPPNARGHRGQGEQWCRRADWVRPQIHPQGRGEGRRKARRPASPDVVNDIEVRLTETGTSGRIPDARISSRRCAGDSQRRGGGSGES